MIAFKSFEEWFAGLEQGVNQAWVYDAADAVKHFGKLYEQYVRYEISKQLNRP